MKLKKIKIKNFRSYYNETEIEFGSLTTFVGKNDIGKSSILEIMDIFFNDGKGVVKLDKDDINKQSLAEGDTTTEITAYFEDLPDRVVIDSTNETSLENEYLLNVDGQLVIKKKFSNAGSPKVFIIAHHPTNPECSELLQKKKQDLEQILNLKGIECEDRTRNATIRSAIWDYYRDSLDRALVEIDVTKGDTKPIWEKLSNYLPMYSLFQADRKNSDSDSEVQDPLREAVKEILREDGIRDQLESIAVVVKSKLQEVASHTLNKLNEMSPEIADTLSPVIPSTDSLKWEDVFKKVSISGDESIPINKRGSGVKRLILLNFFRAEAERRRDIGGKTSVIYAIEEPETSQHTLNQKKLIVALKELSSIPNVQIIITTHSATVVKMLEFSDLRLISFANGIKSVSSVLPGELPYPSLNEVNYLAFNEISAEYHNELYGYIEEQGWLDEYKQGKPTRRYIRVKRNGSTKEEQKILSEYIRHLIHHPENTNNVAYTDEELETSISMMRSFIRSRQIADLPN